MQTLIVIVLIALSQFAASSAVEIQPRIVRGDVAHTGQFPYFAYLEIETEDGIINDYQGCGAALISDEWLITAAECLSYVKRVVVHIGSSKLSVAESGSVITIVEKENFYRYPSYVHAMSINDIGLIRLPKKVTFSKQIQPVRMPATCNPLEIVDAVVMGHGGTDESNNFSANLNYAVLETMTLNACRRAFPFNIFRKSAICAKNDKQNQLVWHGDKGNPLVRVSDGALIGISSFWKQVNTEKGGPQGFTNVHVFLKWIKNVTGLNLPDC